MFRLTYPNISCQYKPPKSGIKDKFVQVDFTRNLNALILWKILIFAKPAEFEVIWGD